jgi:hypothetical protein
MLVFVSRPMDTNVTKSSEACSGIGIAGVDDLDAPDLGANPSAVAEPAKTGQAIERTSGISTMAIRALPHAQQFVARGVTAAP